MVIKGKGVMVARRSTFGLLPASVITAPPLECGACFFRFSLMLARPDDGRAIRSQSSSWADLGGETLISLTKDYRYEQLTQKQLEKMGVVCKRGQTVIGLDTQLGLVEAGL